MRGPRWCQRHRKTRFSIFFFTLSYIMLTVQDCTRSPALFSRRHVVYPSLSDFSRAGFERGRATAPDNPAIKFKVSRQKTIEGSFCPTVGISTLTNQYSEFSISRTQIVNNKASWLVKTTYLISIHCMAHRLAKFEVRRLLESLICQNSETLTALYRYFDKSAQRSQSLTEFQISNFKAIFEDAE